MTPELDKQLCEKYPKIFAQRNLPMTQTAMCWGFPGDGWYWLIDNLCELIQSKIDNQIERNERDTLYNEVIKDAKNGNFDKFYEYYQSFGEDFLVDKRLKIVTEEPTEIFPVYQVEAVQVKEKFGGLRFYIDGGSDEIFTMIHMAEHLSYGICEQCGATKNVTQNETGWISTLCPTCRNKK